MYAAVFSRPTELPSRTSHFPRPDAGRCATLLAILLLLTATGSTAKAALIEHQFGGVITFANPSSGVSPGTRFSGTFSYDPDADPVTLLVPGTKTYEFGNPTPSSTSDTSKLTLSVGGIPLFDGNRLSVGVIDTRDPLAGFFHGLPPATTVGISTGNPQYAISLSLKNLSRSLNPGLELPTFLSLNDFPEANLEVIGISSDGRRNNLLAGRIDSLTTVPEPSLISLLGLTTVGLAVQRGWHRPR
jgi:hypothetical protein